MSDENFNTHVNDNCSPNKKILCTSQDENFNKTHVNGGGTGRKWAARDHANFKL